MRRVWRWIRGVFSLQTVLRDMQRLLYVGQPLAFDKRRGLFIIPRTSWRRPMGLRGPKGVRTFQGPHGRT